MQRHLYPLIILVGIITLMIPATSPGARAQSEPEPPTVRVEEQPDAVRLEWLDTTMHRRSQASSLPDLPLVEMGGYQVPAHLVALRVASDEAIAPQLQRVESIPWTGTLAPAEVPTPRNVEGEEFPALRQESERTLPAAPVVVLREARMRGERIVVVALSPIFQQNDTPSIAAHIDATIPGAMPIDTEPDAAASLLRQQADSNAFLANAPAPRNPAAAGPAIRIHVSSAGMQRVSGAMLAAAGFDLATLTPANLALWHNGAAVPLEEHGTLGGTLDTADELRFYAPPPGDRWNATDTYWLTHEAAPALRMATRSATPGSATLLTTARETGTWMVSDSDTMHYDSNLPGPDGDHWFAAHLRTVLGGDPATVEAPLALNLPAAPGSTWVTVTGEAITESTHRLEVQMGAEVQAAEWSGAGEWTQTFVFASAAQPTVQIRLVPITSSSIVKINAMAWDRPVSLDTGGAGTIFTGNPNTWRYQLGNVAAGSLLYDISDPAAPVRLDTPIAATTIFEDSAPATPHRYLLAGTGTIHTPAVQAHQPIDLSAPINTTAIYIAHADLLAPLAPLVALRQSQGHTVSLINVQDIYDAWSYGQVSPDAIRDFLRYAAATWSTAPRAVTLVGDGTSDPRNYTARNNTTFIPPYLAMIDPWLGETACDVCYAQLDGNDPLADDLADLLIGRLPVKSAAELQALVAKIVGYESATTRAPWLSRAAYITDNPRDETGAIDRAGNFDELVEQGAAMLPRGMTIERLSYDPSPPEVRAPWGEPDPLLAHQGTLDMLNSGPGLLTYIGHSHYWKWASTDVNVDPPHLLGLYDPDTLTNGAQLPIVLAMTCLSSAFQQPAYSGTTIDERLVLHPDGGAVALWGPTGLGVSYGHDTLQRGFYGALWGQASTSTAPATLGSLTQAGYVELFTRGYCCQSTLRTYVLLGDPLTQPRVFAMQMQHVPFVSR